MAEIDKKSLSERDICTKFITPPSFKPAGMPWSSTSSKTIERDDGTKIELTTALDKKRRIDSSYEVYLGLYQAISLGDFLTRWPKKSARISRRPSTNSKPNCTRRRSKTFDRKMSVSTRWTEKWQKKRMSFFPHLPRMFLSPRVLAGMFLSHGI